MFILDDEELQRLTGKSQKRSQVKQLRLMGVRFAERIDGHPIVTKDAVLEYTGMAANDAPEEKATLNTW